MTAPAYTVVVPSYNAAGFIVETLRSVFAQSVPPSRVIVVDDGSTDTTGAVVAGFGHGVEVVRQDNTGPGGATTRGLALVDTEYVATLDHDDLWVPTKIAIQFDCLARDRGVAGVFGRVAEFTADPRAANHDGAYDGWTRTTALFRTDVVAGAGPLKDYPGRLGEMADWLARLREAGHRLVMLPDILALRRVHRDSLTNRDRHELSLSYLSAARDAMLRRRTLRDAGP
ncbi:MAG TPA: glycosyltransferase family A protein [Devosia sp.]|jgi:glycosyltransferase involved in cell wall biosynthesis|nr:glycosyltransferase family A protein [Devosia sp.]